MGRYLHHRVQAAAYCIAAEETLGLPCRRALLVDVERGRVKELRISGAARRLVENLAGELWELARGQFLPRATPRRQRCGSCFYRSICPASRTRM